LIVSKYLIRHPDRDQLDLWMLGFKYSKNLVSESLADYWHILEIDHHFRKFNQLTAFIGNLNRSNCNRPA
jgi:hypothetical protein